MARIFISYRREDEPGYALALARDLSAHFGADEVFKDVDTLEPGTDFVRRIEEAVGSAQVLVAIIGRGWMGTDSQGNRRIDESRDFIRLEVGTALSRDIRVVPVLVRDARMPEEDELPEDLGGLARRHALRLEDAMWAAGVDRLVNAIGRVLAEAEETQAGGGVLQRESAKPVSTHPGGPVSEQRREGRQRLIDGLEERGFKMHPSSTRSWYHPELPEFRVVLLKTTLRLENKNQSGYGRPWQADPHQGFLDYREADYGLAWIDERLDAVRSAPT